MREDPVIALPFARVRAAEGNYVGAVRGRAFAHQPRGHSSLVLLSSLAESILREADGRPLYAIAAAVNAPVENVCAEVTTLARNALVEGPGLPPARRPAPGARAMDLWVHVTNACNLDCPHCYIEKDDRTLDERTIHRLVDSLVATARDGVEKIHLRLAGGEPLLRFDVVRALVDRARAALDRERCELSVALLTNATLVNDEVVRWVREHHVSVSVSIDGVGAAHDALRPRPGQRSSWPLVLAGLDRFAAADISPYALVTVGEDNLDALAELTDWLIDRRMGFRFSLVRDLEEGAASLAHRSAGWTPLVRLRRSSEAPRPRELSPSVEARVIAALDACYRRIEARMPIAPSFRRTHRFCDLDWKKPNRKACGAGDRSLAVSQDLTLSACQAALSDAAAPSLGAGESLARALRDKPALRVLNERVAREPCASCAVRYACAGGCPLLLFRREGDVHGQSPYCAIFSHVWPILLRLSALDLLVEEQLRAPTTV